MPDTALILAAACTGALAVGPFLNHAIVRWIAWRVTLPILMGYVPARAEIGRPQVLCRRCGEPLSWAGRLPLLPWLGIRGKCRRCGEPVAVWALGVELATGLAFGLAAWRAGWSLGLLPVLVLCSGLVAASTVDLTCWRVPARFVYLTVLGAGLAIVMASTLDGEPRSIWGAVVGAVTYYGLLEVLYVASGGRLGRGDVRLGLLCGLVVGWTAWTAELPVYGPISGVLNAALLASLAGLVAGVGRLLVLGVKDASGRPASLAGRVVAVGKSLVRRRNQPYPYGPWLALGTFVTILITV